MFWLKSLTKEFGLSLRTRPVILCDNHGAASLAAILVYHVRTKHIEIDVHFVRDKIFQGELDIRFVLSIDQIADLFTKPLSVGQFLKLKSKLQVEESPFCFRGRMKDNRTILPLLRP